MWDRPDQLSALANLLFAAALLLFLYAVGHRVVHLPAFALRNLSIGGALVHTKAEEVRHIVTRELKGNFFTLDLDEARESFESLPWVRRAEVRRRWPGRLEVTLSEHAPLARWGEVALVNTHGELFDAALEADLPVLLGPPGTEREMARQFAAFRQEFAAVGRVPQQVELSPRRAWRVRLDDGLLVELGREEHNARLARFLATYASTIGRLQQQVEYVDLRYRNGFAAKVPGFKPKEATGRRKG